MDIASEGNLASGPSDQDFKNKLATIIPQMRAFARSLCGNADLADDLVQETMIKAWAARTRFQKDTNFRAWTFTILRNHYFSQVRRNRFVGEWDDDAADRLLATSAKQNDRIYLGDLLRGLQQLPVTQREALVLVGAGGLSYEEAATITGVAIGTVKSRVARARIALEAIMESGTLDIARHNTSSTVDPVTCLLSYVEEIRARASKDKAPIGPEHAQMAA
jgi:RNA polymerase sigma-70 factor (ECF subfamily)